MAKRLLSKRTVGQTTRQKKAKAKPPKKEGNVYDKIVKEVIEKIFSKNSSNINEL